MSVREGRQKELARRALAREMDRMFGLDAPRERVRRPGALRPEPEPEQGPPEMPSELAGIARGVPPTWLAVIFKLDRVKVKDLLFDCPAAGVGKNGHPLYDIAEASKYLVKPKIDLDKYLRKMDARDLPPMLQPYIWDAKLKQQKWEKEAGELWHTSRVMDGYTSTFNSMRQTMRLWVTTVAENTKVTPEQHRVLQALVDSLQQELVERLAKLAATGNTPSSLEDLERVPTEAETDDGDLSDA